MNDEEKLHPVHPGEVLLEEFLKPMGLSQNQLALALRVPARRINEIVHGKRRISADTALRLARYFRMSPQFWLGLQMDYDLDVAEDELGARLRSRSRGHDGVRGTVAPKPINRRQHICPPRRNFTTNYAASFKWQSNKV